MTKIVGADKKSAENMRISVAKNIAGHAFKASRWQAFSKQYKKSE
jgi:hypothetical protein